MPTYGEWLYRRGLSPSTIDARVRFYESRAFGEWPTWDGVTVDQLVAYLSRFVGWTRLSYHSHLISVFDWMVDTGAVATNPAKEVRRGRKPNPRPRPLTERDLARAL